MVAGPGNETRLGSLDEILFRENVLNGTNWFCEGIWFRKNVLCGTEINKNGLIFL